MDKAEVERYVGKTVIVTTIHLGECEPMRIAGIDEKLVYFNAPFAGNHILNRCLISNIKSIRLAYD